MPANADVLSQVAEALRLRGSVSGVISLSPPWGYSMPKTDHIALLVVTRGRIHFEPEGRKDPPLELAPGDVLALPHGHAHVIRDDPRTPVSVVSGPGSCPSAAQQRERGGQTEFIGLCCELAGGRTNPLLKSLPPVIHCPGSEGNVARWLEPSVRLLATESTARAPGRATILNRLAEVVFIQLIRSWIESQPSGEGGWLRALADPQLAMALEAIHSEPGASWTVQALAARSRMSRSAFAGRFKKLVGEAPLEYLTRWRIQRAAGMLEAQDAPLKEIVASSGYASEAAFRTAFKKQLGDSPGNYRSRARSA